MITSVGWLVRSFISSFVFVTHVVIARILQIRCSRQIVLLLTFERSSSKFKLKTAVLSRVA